MSIVLLILLLIVLLLLKGFFSGSEIALVNSDKVKLSAKANQGGKGARVVVIFGSIDNVFPCRCQRRGISLHRITDGCPRLAPRIEYCHSVTGLHILDGEPPKITAFQAGIPGYGQRTQPQVIRVICYHDKIQWATQLRGSPQGSDHLLTFGEAIGCIRPQDVADKSSICRITGMDMGIAEIHALHTGLFTAKVRFAANDLLLAARPSAGPG